VTVKDLHRLFDYSNWANTKLFPVGLHGADDGPGGGQGQRGGEHPRRHPAVTCVEDEPATVADRVTRFAIQQTAGAVIHGHAQTNDSAASPPPPAGTAGSARIQPVLPGVRPTGRHSPGVRTVTLASPPASRR
jgi:hypothetical protein